MSEKLLALIPVALLSLLLIAGGTGCTPSPEEPEVEQTTVTTEPDVGQDDTGAGQEPGPRVVIEPGSGGSTITWEIEQAAAEPIDPQGNTINETVLEILAYAEIVIDYDVNNDGTIEQDVEVDLDYFRITFNELKDAGGDVIWPKQDLEFSRTPGPNGTESLTWKLGGSYLTARAIPDPNDIRELRRDLIEPTVDPDSVMISAKHTIGTTTYSINASGRDILEKIRLRFEN